MWRVCLKGVDDLPRGELDVITGSRDPLTDVTSITNPRGQIAGAVGSGVDSEEAEDDEGGGLRLDFGSRPIWLIAVQDAVSQLMGQGLGALRRCIRSPEHNRLLGPPQFAIDPCGEVSVDDLEVPRACNGPKGILDPFGIVPIEERDRAREGFTLCLADVKDRDPTKSDDSRVSGQHVFRDHRRKNADGSLTTADLSAKRGPCVIASHVARLGMLQ